MSYSGKQGYLDFITGEKPSGFNEKNKEDLLQQSYSGKQGYLDFASSYEPEKEEEISRVRSIISAPIKGLTKEIVDIFAMPFLQLERKDDKLKIISPKQEAEQQIEQVLPTKEGFVESSLERGARAIPWLGLGGAGVKEIAARSAGAGMLGETAKELGAPEWVQALAELPAYAAPKLGTKIIPTKVQEGLVNFARNMGMTEQEIAPLIQSEAKQRWLSKMAIKGGRSQRKLKASYEAIGNIYNKLAEHPDALRNFTPEEIKLFNDEFIPILKKLPVPIREYIAKDAVELAKDGFSGKNLMNFWKDINSAIKKGYSELGQLKNPIFNALERISPGFGEDFKLTNQLYAKYKNIASRLKPDIASKILSGEEALRFAYGLFTGHFPFLTELVGETAARNIAREMLINPRFQNLSKQMIKALNTSKYQLANKLMQNMYRKLKEKYQEDVPDEINDIDFSNLESK